LPRLFHAIRAFLSLLFSGRLPDDLVLELGLMKRVTLTPTPAAVPPPSGDTAVRLLAALQQEARLVDFLLEDIAAYTDEQVGAAVRDVHAKSRDALERHVKLAPVIDGVEGTLTRLEAAGLDPKDKLSYRLLGNIPASAEVEAAVLRHRGWKVTRIDLPPQPAADKAKVVAPAELEVE